jgi:hypothetical protein
MRWGFECKKCGKEQDHSFPSYKAMRQALLVDGIRCVNTFHGTARDRCVGVQMELLPTCCAVAVPRTMRTTVTRENGMVITTTVPDRDDLQITK